MVFITFKPQHREGSQEKTELPFFLDWKSTKWIGAAEIFFFLHYHDKYGKMGRWERKGRDIAYKRKGGWGAHDDRQKRAYQTERPNCVKKKKKSAQFVLGCKLWAERRNKIRHLAGDHVKPCKWMTPQRRALPLSLMMDLIASISVKI